MYTLDMQATRLQTVESDIKNPVKECKVNEQRIKYHGDRFYCQKIDSLSLY